MAENRELALVLKLVADEFQKELKSSQGALGSFNKFIQDWRTQLAAAGTALFAITKSTANYGDELFKTSQKVGINVRSLAGLQHAAKLADVDNRQLQTGLMALSRAMVDSAQGAGEGHEAFTRVGLSATDANGKLKPMEQVLLEVADVFSKTEDGAGKTEVAMKLLGKSGAEMIPLLNGGKASITELMAEAEKLGLVMDEDTARASEAFNDSITRLEAQAKGFSLTIGKFMLGPLTELLSLMNDLGTGPIAGALNSFFKGVNQHIILFGTLIKEVAANIDFLRGKLNFAELGARIKQIEAESSKKLFLLEHPLAEDLLNPKGRSAELSASKPQIRSTIGNADEKKAGKEQEKLGKALLDIFQSQNSALEIRNKLLGGQGQLSEFFLAFDRQEQFRREDEAAEERKGRFIIDQTQSMVRTRDAAQERERAGLIQNVQAWIDYDNQVGASTELRMEHQLDLLRANMASQLKITTEEADKLLQAWDNHESLKADAILDQTALTAQERETIELQSLTKLAAIHQQFGGDIFLGWRMGLQKYIEDTQSAFGFAADLARRTAQMMEGAFRNFFFDIMDNKIKSMKDLFKSFADFAKQMIAQVAAQLATMLVLKGITGGFGGFGIGGLFGGGGGGGSVDAGGLLGGLKFASGGPVIGAGNQDTVRAMLTPGEGVLSRRGMQALAQLNEGGIPGGSREPKVILNFHNAPSDERPTVNFKRQFEGMVIDVFFRNRSALLGHLG
ncbi:MAG: hypothetical protein OEY77_00175 [Nitrospira sp.]|nr:hypothetical protein [Nitrospira sp.]